MLNFNFLFLALEQERQRPYFVDNEFYNNIYNISTKLKYFCIVEREITIGKSICTLNKYIY